MHWAIVATDSRANFVWQLQHLDGGFNLLKFGIFVHQRGILFLSERRVAGLERELETACRALETFARVGRELSLISG